MRKRNVQGKDEKGESVRRIRGKGNRSKKIMNRRNWKRKNKKYGEKNDKG